MQEIIDALKAAGYTYTPNIMEPEYDYPLDFIVRGYDGAMVLCDIEEAARGIIVRLRPYDKFKEWYIEDFEELPTFIEDFEATYKEFAQYIEDHWTW